MSSFLQCSIELLNSYDFVKQKKCKRGLLKSKGSYPCLDCVFHPNLWSNLYPPPGPNRAASISKGPDSSWRCPESTVPPFMTLAGLFWPEAAGGRGYQNQLHPWVWAQRALPYGLQPLCFAHSSTARAGVTDQLSTPPSQGTSLSPGREHQTHLGLLQEEKRRTEHLSLLFKHLLHDTGLRHPSSSFPAPALLPPARSLCTTSPS